MRSTLALAVILVPCAWLVGDEPPRRERPRLEPRMFDRLDVNQDGVITLDEIPAARRERAARLIERLDANGDGKVTRQEFNEGIQRLRPPGDQPPQRKRVDGAPGKTGESRRAAAPDEPRRDAAGRPTAGGSALLFRLLDTDGDGKLSREELAKAAEIIMKLDSDHDGFVTSRELLEGLGGTSAATTPAPGDEPALELAGRVIRRADKNGDGKLTKEELPEMMRGRFDEMDTNHDGAIDRAELAGSVARMRRTVRDAAGAAGAGPLRRPGSAEPDGGGRANAAIAANRPRVAAFLRRHDKDADGQVSAAEFPRDKAALFKKLDANGDGYLTPDEIARGIDELEAGLGDGAAGAAKANQE